MPVLVVFVCFLVFREPCNKLLGHILLCLLGDTPDVLASVWVGVYDGGSHESVAGFEAEAVADGIHVGFKRDGVREVLRGDVDGCIFPVPRTNVYASAFRAVSNEIPTVAACVTVCFQVIYADGAADGTVRV